SADIEELDLQPQAARSCLHLFHRGLTNDSIGRIDEHGHTRCSRHQLTQEFQPLRRQLTRENIDTCQVAARPSEACNKTEPDRVFGDDEDDGDRRGCGLSGERRGDTWGTSSPDDKLVSDLAKATEAIKIAARRSDRLMAGKLSPPNFGLLQQYLPKADIWRHGVPCRSESRGQLYQEIVTVLFKDRLRC